MAEMVATLASGGTNGGHGGFDSERRGIRGPGECLGFQFWAIPLISYQIAKQL